MLSLSPTAAPAAAARSLLRPRSMLVIFFTLLLSYPASAQINPRQLLTLSAIPGQDRVRSGDTLDVLLVAELKEGWHINSNKPLEEYIIPSTVVVDKGAFELLHTFWPRAQLKKFAFSSTPMAVYEQELLVGLRLVVLDEDEKKSYKLAGTFGYQACNDQVCLPPAKLPFSLEIKTGAPTQRTKDARFSRVFAQGKAQPAGARIQQGK